MFLFKDAGKASAKSVKKESSSDDSDEESSDEEPPKTQVKVRKVKLMEANFEILKFWTLDSDTRMCYGFVHLQPSKVSKESSSVEEESEDESSSEEEEPSKTPKKKVWLYPALVNFLVFRFPFSFIFFCNLSRAWMLL